MDPLTPANNQTDNSQQQSQAAQAQPEPQQVSTGGFSPEVVSAPASQEANIPKEAGYENIQQIERKAEEIEHKEVSRPTPQPQPQQQPKPEQKTESAEKKEPKGPKFKYFGYKPPQTLMANLSRLRSQAYRGSASDSKTWLLFFLDRLAKKEDK